MKTVYADDGTLYITEIYDSDLVEEETEDGSRKVLYINDTTQFDLYEMGYEYDSPVWINCTVKEMRRSSNYSLNGVYLFFGYGLNANYCCEYYPTDIARIYAWLPYEHFWLSFDAYERNNF
jgi:hypothetical protein